VGLGLGKFRIFVAAVLAACAAVSFAMAQEPAQTKPAEPGQAHGRLILVLPFENKTGTGGLDWVGEAFPDILNRRLNSVGYLTIGRGDRLYAFDHLGLPLNLQPSRAMTIRIAQTLDADYVVFGSYTQGNDHQLEATAGVLDVSALRLGQAIDQSGDQDQLVTLINSLAWKVTKQLDPNFAVEEQTFVAADGALHSDAFAAYIQGLVAQAPDQQVGHLREAVRLDPDFDPAWLALGRAYFSNQDYTSAAQTLGRLPKDDPNALQADFYRGLACFYTGNYSEAEDAFAFDSARLPLPEVVNNQGVAASRRGKDATALFQQAVTADPRDPDYHFNLAVALDHRGDTAGALDQIEEELKLRPGDSEAQSFEAQLKNPQPQQANPDPGHAITDPNAADSGIPLERIKRSYSEAGFRQAAFEMEQMQQMRLTSMPAEQRSAALVKDGDAFFGRGLVLEAEREYREALAADSASAPAHAGLAAVEERDGNPDAARQEAQASIGLQPNVAAYLVLARIDLEANQLDAAQNDVAGALRVDPNNANAKGMEMAIARHQNGSH
jgi:tetratricopeptide (TPR) repeat protein